MNDAIAAVIVLFHPDVAEVKRNIHSWLSFVVRVYVVDNTPVESQQINADFSGESKIIYIRNGRNEGIARALNKGAGMAYETGHRWLLTMDQDSFFEEGQAEKYFSSFRRLFINDDSVAVVAPSHFVDASETNKEYVSEMAVITSGSIINLTAWKKTGGYDDKLFIDEVDHDYCYKTKLNGYSVFRFTTIFLNHKLGTQKEVGYAGNIAKRKRIIHSSQRVYFMVRNYLYVRKKYKMHFPEEFKERDKMLLTALKNNVLFSGSFFNNLSSILKGYRDFKKNNFDSAI